jgi:GAF domain-containing protein
MKRFFERLLTPSAGSENEVQYWRERIVAVALIGSALLGTGAYAINLVITVQNQAWLWVIIYTLVYAGIIFISLTKRLPYNIRAGTLLSLLYFLGIISALQFGSAGDARIWLIGFSILSGIFIGIRAGIGASVISTLTLLTLGFLMNRRWITPPLPSDITNPANFSSWLSTSLPFFALSIMTVLTLGVMLNGLNRSLQRGRQLTSDLEEDRRHLEKHAHELERREVQIRTASEISRVISAELNFDRLLQQVVDLVKDRFDLYYVGVFINDEKGLYAELKAGTGEAGQNLITDGYKVAIGGTSMVGWAISRRQARIGFDTGLDAIHFEIPYLPETRSELAIPMVSASQMIGAISVLSVLPEAFDQEDIIVLQGVADGLATAIENAWLFQQTQENLQEIQSLHQQYLGKSWSEAIRREDGLSYTFEGQPDAEIDSTEEAGDIIDVPLVLRDQVIGSIRLEGDQKTWSENDRAFIEAVTTQAALALENIRLVEESRLTAQHDRVLTDITSQVWATSDIDMILQTTVRELGRTLQATDGLIRLEAPQENGKPKKE